MFIGLACGDYLSGREDDAVAGGKGADHAGGQHRFSAVVITATCEEVLGWMEVAVGRGELSFPDSNGPVPWSNGVLAEALRPELEPMKIAA